MSVISSGTVIVSGVTSTGFEVVQKGVLRVLNNGRANEVAASSGGAVAVSSGGVLYLCQVGSGGTATVMKNGYGEDVTVESGGTYLVSSGGTAHKSLILSGGTQVVFAEVMAASATVQGGGKLIVSSGGYLRGAVISANGFVEVWSQALVDVPRVYGSITVNAGAAVNSARVLEGGLIHILSNGSAYKAVFSSGGSMNVDYAGTVNSATISAGGGVTVLSGGSCVVATVVGGSLGIDNGGFASRAAVNTGGMFSVSSGGTATSTTVNSGGRLSVSSGGTASGIVENGGYVSLEAGAEAAFVSHTISALTLTGVSATVHSMTTADGVRLESGGFLQICEGGAAAGTTVGAGGLLCVSEGGTVDGTDVDGGELYVSTGATASLTTIGAHGAIYVSSGGTAVDLVENGGCVYYKSGAVIAFAAHAFSGLSLTDDEATVHSGTTAVSTTVGSGGFLRVSSGGSATDTTAGGQGRITVYSDGRASRTTLNDQGGCEVMFRGAITDAEVNAGGSLVVYSRATADGATVNSGGRFTVYEGGSAAGIVENGGYVSAAKGAVVAFNSHTVSALELAAASATVHAGTVAAGWTVNEGGRMDVFDGGIADATAVNPSGTLNVYSGGRLAGRTTFGSGAAVSMFEGAVVDFDLTRIAPGEAALVNDWSVIRGTPVCTLRVDTAVAIGSYTYVLAEGAAAFDGTITVANAEGGALGTLGVGETLRDGYTGCTLNLNGASLTLTVFAPDLTPTNPAGTADRVSWDPNWAETYTVEFSTDGFEHVLRAETSGTAVDLLALPAGTYQWRVTADAQSEWAVGNDLVSDHDPEVPEVLRSNDDGCGDVFFAEQDGVWDNRWGACHVGSLNDWSGTRELILTTGRGRIRNLFFGSDDPNVLCLTDLENGDALFVDDVYTELPEGVAEQQARLYRIREIRAGAGDDVVDMTSQRFEYTGSGLTVRGGDGDDVIWANKGSNRLFGDSGNDRIVGASGDDVIAGGSGDDSMHGGGGDDVFTFGENWGADTVEQLETGSVTLWFASGGIENWDPATLTYTDGDNRVRVTGVTADRIALEFGGGDDPARYESLRAMGAFDAFTSEKIFEAGGTGFLASL